MAPWLVKLLNFGDIDSAIFNCFLCGSSDADNDQPLDSHNDGKSSKRVHVFSFVEMVFFSYKGVFFASKTLDRVGV